MKQPHWYVAAVTQSKNTPKRVRDSALALICSMSGPSLSGQSYAGPEADVRALAPLLLAAGWEQVKVFRWQEETDFWLTSFTDEWEFGAQARKAHGTPELVKAQDVVAGDVVWLRGSTRPYATVIRWVTTREGRIYISDVHGTLDPEQPLTIFRHHAERTAPHA